MKEKNSIYLSNKTDELIASFGDENIKRYIGYYENMPSSLRPFFSLCHYQLNYLLKYMNGRLHSGRYTASESRGLIELIEEIKTVQSNLMGSKESFDLVPYYKKVLLDCEAFLLASGGSPIPHDFEKINIIENQSIFSLQSSHSILRGNKMVLFPTKSIGSGSYASVHKYKDEYYNRTFVVKKAFKSLSDKEKKRFKIEFEEMKKLNSPYVIEVYKFDEVNHQYIMEYADETLDSYIKNNNNTLDVHERVSMVRQIFRAFIYINSKGVLHRDVSTSNVLIKKYEGLNIIKVSDFGLVKRSDSTLTSLNTEFKGSLNDPKLEILGFSNYEVRHETYALTRLIYFVMTGRTKLDSFKSKEFEAFIMIGISDNIDERYKSVEELRDAFNKMVGNFIK